MFFLKGAKSFLINSFLGGGAERQASYIVRRINFEKVFSLDDRFDYNNIDSIKVNVLGQNKGLPKDIRRIVKFIKKKTIKSKVITLNLALNYGSKEEIISACRKMIKSKKQLFNNENFEKGLYTRNIPDPDILIRTGGTKRLSNFLLWQLAYTEIFFVDKLWPDFNKHDFNKIIKQFYRIKRNFGNI